MVSINPLGSLNPLNALATAASGNLVSLATRNLVSSFGQNLIQQLGSALGLPQPLIDAAQGQFALASGDPLGAAQNYREAAEGFAGALGDSPLGQAEFARNADEALARMGSDIAGGEELRAARAGGGKAAGSWLMALASALGDKANDLAGQMKELADDMSAENSKPKDSMLFSAKSQEFGLFMNAANTALKTAGESLTTMARKGS